MLYGSIGLRRVGLAVAALIGCDRAEAGVGERLQLVAPRVPELGKAVAEEHREAAAGFDDVHADAVGVDVLVGEFRHCSSEIARTGF